MSATREPCITWQCFLSNSVSIKGETLRDVFVRVDARFARPRLLDATRRRRRTLIRRVQLAPQRRLADTEQFAYAVAIAAACFERRANLVRFDATAALTQR